MVKNIRFVVFMMLASVILLCGNLVAQTANIGYVDMRQVFAGYKKAQTAEANFKQEVEAEKKKIDQCKEDITCMQAEFEQKKDILKPTEKAKKEEELKEKVKEYFSLAETTNKQLDTKRQELEEKLLEEIRKEVNKYGSAKGVSVILDSRMVLFGQPGMDLTEEIIKVLNAKQ
jgi:Skp family chaperone for outer membrane proteins